jgi:arsenite methyltransferase
MDHMARRQDPSRRPLTAKGVLASGLTTASVRLNHTAVLGSLQLHAAPMNRLPLPDASVDAVVSTNTIYFVPELDVALTEIARVLRPRGRLALGVGDPAAMRKMPFTKRGFRLRPADEIIDCLSRAGFSVVEDQRVGHDGRAFHVISGELRTTAPRL